MGSFEINTDELKLINSQYRKSGRELSNASGRIRRLLRNLNSQRGFGIETVTNNLTCLSNNANAHSRDAYAFGGFLKDLETITSNTETWVSKEMYLATPKKMNLRNLVATAITMLAGFSLSTPLVLPIATWLKKYMEKGALSDMGSGITSSKPPQPSFPIDTTPDHTSNPDTNKSTNQTPDKAMDSSSAESSENIPVQDKSDSTTLKDMSLPDNCPGDWKRYMGFNKITDKTSPQYAFQQKAPLYVDDAGMQRYKDDRLPEDAYVVAMASSYYNSEGGIYKITHANGKVIHVVTGDLKADQHTDPNNMFTNYNDPSKPEIGCMIEFLVDSTHSSDAAREMRYHGTIRPGVNFNYELFNELSSPIVSIEQYPFTALGDK